MAEKTNVYVIGAGASEEAGMPTGERLKASIANLLKIEVSMPNIPFDSGNAQIHRVLRSYLQSAPAAEDTGLITDYVNAARKIREGLPFATSIDSFLDAHRDNTKIKLCGKLGIVRAILEAEANSIFTSNHSTPKLDTEKLSKTWYMPFFQMLTDGHHVNDLSKRFDKFTLIIFNYDRCIEQFIYHALIQHYGISPNKSAKLVSKLHIYHPYGTVGDLPWINKSGAVEYGQAIEMKALLDTANNIKTFTDEMDSQSTQFMETGARLTAANQVIFLGFAFHDINMKLLSAMRQTGKFNHPTFYASTFGFSNDAQDVVPRQH
jgi:hypothetical protein